MFLPVPLVKKCLASVSGVPQKLHFGTDALKGMMVAVPPVLSVIVVLSFLRQRCPPYPECFFTVILTIHSNTMHTE